MLKVLLFYYSVLQQLFIFFNMNQPSNNLINHLGLTNIWYSYSLYSSKYQRYTFLNILNINYYLKILFKNGIIYTFHLFYHKYFFQFVQLFTLPVYITQWTFSKFYRFYKIKMIKKNIYYENIFNLCIYRWFIFID